MFPGELSGTAVRLRLLISHEFVRHTSFREEAILLMLPVSHPSPFAGQPYPSGPTPFQVPRWGRTGGRAGPKGFECGSKGTPCDAALRANI